MTKLTYRIVTLLLTALVLFYCVFSFSYSWFSGAKNTREDRLNAHVLTQYFAGGNGSPATPYLINSPTHIYNLIWLQNKNYFTDENGTAQVYYFKIADGVSEIDMAGAFSGTGTVTGAVPPIGSKDNPFTGYFDGNGCTIKNLWVSSDPNDWMEKPLSFNNVDYSYGVGFFGYVQKSGIGTNVNVSNFYLQNIEVTVKREQITSVVGLIAGYVDGKMSRIGVDNGIITVKGTGNPVQSAYSLVGALSEGTTWVDLPGNEAGGEMIIAPNGLIEGGETVANAAPSTPNGDITTSAKLPDGRYSARYCGTLTKSSPSPQPSSFYGTANAYSFSTSGASISKSTAVDTTTLPGAATDASLISFNRYATGGTSYRVETSSFYGIYASAPPDFSGVTDWTKYPTNCIWFKPLNTGNCFIAFGIEQNNDNSYKSIYRFKRDSTGKIIGTPEEMVLTFVKGIGNGSVVLFNLEITDISYEYCIGNRAGNNTNPAYFFFLKLAGTSTTGGGAAGGMAKALDKIEFVEPEEDGYPDFNETTYAPAKTHLSFTGTGTADSAVLNFCKSGGTLYYRNSVAGITVTENVQNSAISSSASFDYPPREDTAQDGE